MGGLGFSQAETGIDSSFLNELSTVEGLVENYARYNKKLRETDFASKDPAILRARVMEAKMSLVAEIGDSFSWFCAVLNKLDSILKSMYDDSEKAWRFLRPLEQVLNGEYIDDSGKARYPSCKKKPCICVFYNLTRGN